MFSTTVLERGLIASANPNRKQLHLFLVECRRRLTPCDVGLNRPVRRQKHLSQVDVAEIIGVSVNWYEKFESGRGNRRVSREFLERLATALRLDAASHSELLRLAKPLTQSSEQRDNRTHFSRRHDD